MEAICSLLRVLHHCPFLSHQWTCNYFEMPPNGHNKYIYSIRDRDIFNLTRETKQKFKKMFYLMGRS